MRIIDALTNARQRLERSGIDTARLDAEVLLSHVLGCDRASLHLSRNDSLDPESIARFNAAIERREGRCPVAYITGTKEFWSLPIKVTQDVLIPRPDTETIVEQALRIAGERSRRLRILDICTGSGCIAAALASELTNAEITATDSSTAALEVARQNTAFASDRCSLLCGDLFEPLAGSTARFDIITANPPYVTEDEYSALTREITEYEPRQALLAGKSGLDFILRIIEDAPQFLVPGGWLLMEVGASQAPECKTFAMGCEGYDTISTANDLAGIERVVMLRKNILDH